MNAYDIAECHRLLHDRGLKGWKLLMVRGNLPTHRWLTLWDHEGKMVASIAQTANGMDYYAHAQRMKGQNTWVLPSRLEAMSVALDHWLAYKDEEA